MGCEFESQNQLESKLLKGGGVGDYIIPFYVGLMAQGSGLT